MDDWDSEALFPPYDPVPSTRCHYYHLAHHPVEKPGTILVESNNKRKPYLGTLVVERTS